MIVLVAADSKSVHCCLRIRVVGTMESVVMVIHLLYIAGYANLKKGTSAAGPKRELLIDSAARGLASHVVYVVFG